MECKHYFRLEGENLKAFRKVYELLSNLYKGVMQMETKVIPGTEEAVIRFFQFIVDAGIIERMIAHQEKEQEAGKTPVDGQAHLKRGENMHKLLTIPETAEIIGVSVQAAYQLARENKIPVVRIGRRVRVNSIKLQEWINNGGCSFPGGKDFRQEDIST